MWEFGDMKGDQVKKSGEWGGGILFENANPHFF